MRAIVPGVEWPSILVGHNAHALAIQFQFQQTQWWSPERLREHQFAQLAALVRHAGDTVPYYRAVFKNMGFDHRDTLDEAAWAALPILSRNDLQDTYSKLHSERCPPSHGRLFESASSGSTGTPIKVSKAGIQQLMWEAVSLRDHLWQRRDFSGRAAAIRNPPTQTGGAPYPDGRYSESWGKPTTPFHTGSAYMLELATPINQQVEWLGRIAPSYLLSYPSNIEALSHHCLDYGISLPSIREFRSVSEVLRPEVREICRRAFGCKVTDIYSAEEVGYIALQSPDSEELLVQSETIFAEVVDQDGRPCAPGEVGRLVVTPLHAFAMPLLRYAIGDLARLGGPASCGRGLPVLAEVLGRERQMVRLPNGTMHYPNFRSFTAGFDKIRQFQLVRKSETLLEMRMVARAPLDQAEANRMTLRIHERFKFPFEVTFIYMDVIPREPSGKFFDFKTEVG